MASSGIIFTGVKELSGKLNSIARMSAVKAIVKANGAELTQKMTQNAEFSGGYSTGATKQTISVNSGIRSDGLEAYAGPDTEYAGYVEHGTRFMQAQPFVKPAFDDQKEAFKKDLDKLI